MITAIYTHPDTRHKIPVLICRGQEVDGKRNCRILIEHPCFQLGGTYDLEVHALAFPRMVDMVELDEKTHLQIFDCGMLKIEPDGFTWCRTPWTPEQITHHRTSQASALSRRSAAEADAAPAPTLNSSPSQL